MKDLIKKLQDLMKTFPKKRPKRGDDFNPMDWSGSNFDDCYEMGFLDGESYFAERVKERIETIIKDTNLD
jgi:hypothetical protein